MGDHSEEGKQRATDLTYLAHPPMPCSFVYKTALPPPSAFLSMLLGEMGMIHSHLCICNFQDPTHDIHRDAYNQGLNVKAYKDVSASTRKNTESGTITPHVQIAALIAY